MKKALPLLAILFSFSTCPAAAQERPFVFTVATSWSAAQSERRGWTAYYDAGYAERASEPFGYDGVLQRVGFQGRLARRTTLLGHARFGSRSEDLSDAAWDVGKIFVC